MNKIKKNITHKINIFKINTKNYIKLKLTLHHPTTLISHINITKF